MNAHIMVDLETWGTEPGSDIRSIGAVVFDPIKRTLGAEFYANIRDGEHYGLKRDPATVKWWSEQSEAAQSVLLENQLNLPHALHLFNDWWTEQQGGEATRDEYATFWANGPHFDYVLLNCAYDVTAIPRPYIYRAPRDCKTIWEAAGGVDVPFRGTEHNALDDAKHQAQCVIEAYKQLQYYT